MAVSCHCIPLVPGSESPGSGSCVECEIPNSPQGDPPAGDRDIFATGLDPWVSWQKLGGFFESRDEEQKSKVNPCMVAFQGAEGGSKSGLKIPVKDTNAQIQCQGDRNSYRLGARAWSSSNYQLNELLVAERQNLSSPCPDLVGQLSQHELGLDCLQPCWALSGEGGFLPWGRAAQALGGAGIPALGENSSSPGGSRNSCPGRAGAPALGKNSSSPGGSRNSCLGEQELLPWGEQEFLPGRAAPALGGAGVPAWAPVDRLSPALGRCAWSWGHLVHSAGAGGAQGSDSSWGSRHRDLGLAFPDSETVFKRSLKAELCLVPPGKDPGGLRQQPAVGEAWQRVIKGLRCSRGWGLWAPHCPPKGKPGRAHSVGGCLGGPSADLPPVPALSRISLASQLSNPSLCPEGFHHSCLLPAQASALLGLSEQHFSPGSSCLSSQRSLQPAAEPPGGTGVLLGPCLPSPGLCCRFVYVWDTTSRRILYKLPGHAGSVNELAFHPEEPITAPGLTELLILWESISRFRGGRAVFARLQLAQGLWDWAGDTQRAAGWHLLDREERVWNSWDARGVTMFGDSMRTWITWEPEGS
ncbi:hypothetical protein DV515_00017834 [Chloebia gouldiae]|uniref:Uncharacterized protein n=1 Tax=Chloebia gouldiae TaxID=44316 RepID=A0A3L8Q992_CHLGU|nr:hypothetical protein DV515_00017834 [Chloebia gouldiae]